MEVKIYREPENQNLIIDEDQLNEYREFVSKNGLKNQLKETQTPNVYIHINSSMQKMLQALCPASEKIENYTSSTIPLEVLKVYDYAKKNEMFDDFQIWYANKEKDPLLIGRKWRSESDKKNNYSWNMDNYLIARWGDESLEIEQLLKKGFNAIKLSLIDSAQDVLGMAKLIIENPDSYVRKHLKNNLSLPQFDLNGNIGIGELPF